MNLYYYGTRSTNSNIDNYYFEKEKGKFEYLTYASFSLAISDNQHALQELQRLYPKRKIPAYDIQGNSQNLARIVEIYNQ